MTYSHCPTQRSLPGFSLIPRLVCYPEYRLTAMLEHIMWPWRWRMRRACRTYRASWLMLSMWMMHRFLLHLQQTYLSLKKPMFQQLSIQHLQQTPMEIHWLIACLVSMLLYLMLMPHPVWLHWRLQRIMRPRNSIFSLLQHRMESWRTHWTSRWMSRMWTMILLWHRALLRWLMKTPLIAIHLQHQM